MEKLIILIFTLFTSNIYSQKCPDNLNYTLNGNSNSNSDITVYIIDINQNIIGSITCQTNGNGNGNTTHINCDSLELELYEYFMFINEYGIHTDTCIYGNNGHPIINLPIELVNFSLDKYDDNVKINWTTGSELNNDYFTIERSFDGYAWKEIDRIKGVGNSSSLIDYSYIDRQSNLSGIVYYRLKQTDYDGKFERFHIKSINMGDREIVKILNLLGQEVDMNYKGLKIIIHNNGDRIKVY